ncbi:hypothetical protein HC891_21080, partial [Candidatus Gracilibacteria bacterium]|nr:hypothetical protein [Candidatus Gracilibacteria bacterium]
MFAASLFRMFSILSTLLVLLSAVVVSRQISRPLRFVDQDGAALANARLRIVCFHSPDAMTVLADRWINTDAFGLPVSALPAACSHLAALQLQHTQPAGKPGRTTAYHVFSSSFAPGAVSALPATGDIALRAEWPLVLFDVAVSVEWQPDATFLQELHAGLRAASAYLYDLSEGQLAFGALRITTDGANWASADLRFRAANDYRPSAHIGGIVVEPQSYIAPSGQRVTFAPGDVLFGRYWSGRSAADAVRGAWDQPNAYRTIAHEWGHYALFLYDSYRQTTASGTRETYCTCQDLPLVGRSTSACAGIAASAAASAMSYHYSASEFWLEGAPPACVGTDQARLHGASDWATLARWSAIQGLPEEWLRLPAALDVGPAPGLVDHFFGTTPAIDMSALFLPLVANAGGVAADIPRSVPIALTVDAELSTPERLALAPQVYTLSSTAGGRAVYQGTSHGTRTASQSLGTLDLLGIRNERLHVQLDRFGSDERYSYRGAARAADSLQLTAESWRPALIFSRSSCQASARSLLCF